MKIRKDNRPPKELRVLKRGHINGDMVFYEYSAECKNGERWFSKERFNIEYEKDKTYIKQYSKKNRVGLLNYYKKYNKQNSVSRKMWFIENNEHIRVYRNNLSKKRKEIDPAYKVVCLARSRVSKELKNKNIKKRIKTLDLIGCSPIELKTYIEKRFLNGMSWNNYGKWHIDHIVPCSSFNLTNELELKKCFHYSNLQPLWAIDNLRKGNKIKD